MRSSSTCRSGRRIAALTIAVAGAIAASAVPARAVDPDRTMAQYLHDRWQSENGFPGGAVHAIAQSSDGYLWIGAEKGLVRFDGLSFRILQPPGPTSGRDSAVLGIRADAGSGLWALMRNATLIRYRNDAFEDLPPEFGALLPSVTAMASGQDGALLLAMLDRGVVAYRASMASRASTASRASAATRPNQLETILAQPATPSSFVMAIAQTPDGDIWLGTRDSGLLRVHQGRVTPIVKGLPDQKINALLVSEHELWIGTDNGVARWNGLEVTRTGLPAALEHVAALAMIRDRDSNVWIGTATGQLLRVNARGVATLDERDDRESPRGRTVTAVFEDRDGNIWIGTTRGIERLRDGMFTTYWSAQGLPAGSFGPVFAESGRTWIGPGNGGLYWLAGDRTGSVKLDGLANDVVYSISGQDGDVWLGRQRGGLTRLRVEGGEVTARSFTQANGLAQNNVYAVHRARDGSVWAGTLSGGVSRLKDGAFTTFTTRDGLSSNTVTAILETTDGTIWLATPNGVNVRSGNTWRRVAAADGLPSNDVNTLFEDSAHNVWIGTAAGLALMRDGRVQLDFHAPDPLTSSIVGIAEGRLGFLWVATVDGVLRARRERLASNTLGDGDLQEYGPADGLLGVEGVKRHRSMLIDPDGRIWLSTNRAVSVANPLRAARRATPALVHIEELSADGAVLDPRAGTTVPASRHRITLSYAGLSLSMPERMRFRYRLDGFDRDWSEPAAARQAVYTNLGPGAYRFHVIASNGDGVWSDAEAALAFSIAPAFWQTSWFRVSAVLALTALAWAIYRVRVLQLAQQLNVRFDERLAERTRIAQELHDTLLQGFVSASMQLHVAVDRLPDDSPARSSLSRVLDLMGRVIEEGRHAVRGLRSPTAAAHDLEKAFSGISGELDVDGQVDYRVIVEGRDRPLKPFIRDEVYRIGREAVVNAFRHSAAKRIELELEYASSGLRMLVRDNGQGIDAGVLRSGSDGHWGLSGMRERADRIGARFKVFSSAGAGTEIELSVPARVAFAQENRS